jgi:hypothetical protein
VSSPIDAVPLLLDQLDLLWRSGHWSHLWATVRLCSLVAGDLQNDELAFGLESAVAHAGLAMPALPVDAAALQAQNERIRGAHRPEWAERTAAIAATWDVDTIVGLIRADFSRAVAAATR